MMPPASAKDMLMQVKRYADGGDVSSAGLAKAMSSGLTQTQYDDNIRAYIAKTANPLDALNAASENGVSMADINRALGKQVAADYFTTDYNTETAPSTNVATGFTSPIAQRYNAPGAQGQSALDAEIKKVSQQYADNTSANAQILRDMFIQEGGSIADLQRAGFDPSRLLGTVAKKPVVPPVTPIPTPYTQTQPTYTAPTVYQPLPEPPPIYAAGQPALDVAFRNSAPRTYDPVYGYTYSPAAKLLSATGSGMSFTPPSVTSRPRDLLKVPLPTAANPQLSASQVFARDLQAKQQLAALPGGRFVGQTAPIRTLEEATNPNPNAITPTEFRFYAPPPVGLAQGGTVKKPEGSLAATAPMSQADLLAQIDRSTAATPSAVTPDRDPVKTESAGMLSRLNDAFGRNISQPIVGSAIDMTAGLGDILQMGTKYLANRAGFETQPFTPVAPAIQEAAGTAGYDPYSPAALAASVLLPAAAPLRTAAAATRPMMSMAAAPGSARETLSLIKPILDREASVAASAELAAMGARELAPDNVTAEIAAAIAGGGTYNTLDNILSSASRGPTTSGIIKEGGGNWIGEGIDDEMEKLRLSNWGRGLRDTPESMLEQMYARYTPEAIASLSPDLARNVTDSIEGLKAKSQINKWIGTKLSKYIRNEMATEGDPIRALAERGVLHVNPVDVGINRYAAPLERKMAGYPEGGLGQSYSAKAWEDASDVSITSNKAEDFIIPRESEYLSPAALSRINTDFMEKNPWLLKLAPKTNVYDLPRQAGYGKRLIQGLGFDHLIDELNNATRPDTDLPERLRIDYNKLDRMSVPQIVEKVADINSWRVENMSKANQALANNAATHFDLQLGLGNKTYPETGLRWAQLRMPDGETDPTTLQAALKYEGDTMGHCVGGYCDDVAANSTQIFSLRDAKGAPHVTIETEFNKFLSGDRLNEAEPGLFDLYKESLDFAPDGSMHEWLQKNRPEIFERLLNTPSIVQIKGKGNAAPAEKYLPAVQDFVSSRTWSEVGDLSNAKMSPIGNGRYISDAKLKEVADRHFVNYFGNKPDQSESAEEYYARIRRYNPDILSEEDKNFLDDIKNGNFAKGGEVLAYAQGGYVTKKTKGA
jgi:hypothetical protein